MSILQPIPAQLEEWSVDLAGRLFSEKTVRSALVKDRTAGLLQGTYWSFYETSAVNRGLLPPYVEGMWRMYAKTLPSADTAVFKDLPALWVYERRLLEAGLGRDRVVHLQPITWDDLHQNFGPSWSSNAAEFRVVLGDSRVGDIPKLICGWRDILRRWCLRKQQVPVVTPDRQHELFLFLLGAALGEVLLQAGWQMAYEFGQEVSLAKDTRVFSPFRLVTELSSGKLSSGQYQMECEEAGIGDLSLGAPE